MDSITAKGNQLCYLIIQELAMKRKSPPELRDDVFLSMCNCIHEILDKHELLFNGMVQRVGLIDYLEFVQVANELFEMNSNPPPPTTEQPTATDFETIHLKITWARIVSLFAFSVRLAQDKRHDSNRVDNITTYLSTYLTKHIIQFVRLNGGWDGLVEQFPITTPQTTSADHLLNSQYKKAILLSGLCVGILATSIFITSLLNR